MGENALNKAASDSIASDGIASDGIASNRIASDGIASDKDALQGLAAPGPLTAARLFFFCTALLAAVSMPRLVEHGKLSGQVLGTYSTQWVVLLGITGMIALLDVLVLVLLFTRTRERLGRWFSSVLESLAHLRIANFIGLGAAWAVYILLILYRYQKQFADFVPQVWIFWTAVGVGAVFLMALLRNKQRALPFFLALLFTALLYGFGVRAAGYLPEITNFPFSLEWSEASRYYYASLPFAGRMYGFPIPLSVLHPTRYLLQGIPFAIPDLPLWAHRLWQVLLWLGIGLLMGWTLARRFHFSHRMAALAVILWTALYVQEGYIYYHLAVCVLLVLLGFDYRRFWRTLGFVVLASAWAGISRVNWIPVPAILAASLYLLERPRCESADWRRYLAPPFLWSIAGGAAALASQAAYVLVSGQEDKGAFSSSFTSDLLWYRLFPSPTFRMGVLSAILLVSIPLLILIAGNWIAHRKDWHPLRVLGLGGMLLVLFAGGLVVSVKIGGGSNVHNLDAFIALLIVVGAVIGLGGFGTETGALPTVWRPWPLVLAVIALPVIWNINVGDPFVKRDFKQAAYDLNSLNAFVQKHAGEGDILFITQRQVVVFKQLPNIRMVPDYELMTLMEMAMANNQTYLDRFYSDLSSHRFALIVADHQVNNIKNPAADAFAEENNAWVTRVSIPILKYYKKEQFFDTQGIELLVPKR